MVLPWPNDLMDTTCEDVIFFVFREIGIGP